MSGSRTATGAEAHRDKFEEGHVKAATHHTVAAFLDCCHKACGLLGRRLGGALVEGLDRIPISPTRVDHLPRGIRAGELGDDRHQLLDRLLVDDAVQVL